MQTGFLPGLPSLPRVLQPDSPSEPLTSPSALAEWASENQTWLDEELLRYGALLFRGFAVTTEEEFQAIASQFVRDFGDYKGGTSPRTRVSGAVSTSTDMAQFVPIPLHLEMSYFDEYPRRILFFCKTPPKEGGQTPLADMRAFYADLNPDVRATLEERGIRLIQNIPNKRSRLRPSTRPWPEMFGWDKEAAAAYCAQHGIDASWNPNGSMRLIARRPVSILHPGTGERIWFGPVYGHDSFSWELDRVGKRLAAWYTRMGEKRRRGKVVEEMPYQVTYGDGTEIPIKDVEYLRRTLWEHAILFDWQQGDVLVLDNSRIAHGRMPYKGARRIRAALSESIPVVAAPRVEERARIAPEITV